MKSKLVTWYIFQHYKTFPVVYRIWTICDFWVFVLPLFSIYSEIPELARLNEMLFLADNISMFFLAFFFTEDLKGNKAVSLDTALTTY